MWSKFRKYLCYQLETTVHYCPKVCMLPSGFTQPCPCELLADDERRYSWLRELPILPPESWRYISTEIVILHLPATREGLQWRRKLWYKCWNWSVGCTHYGLIWVSWGCSQLGKIGQWSKPFWKRSLGELFYKCLYLLSIA